MNVVDLGEVALSVKGSDRGADHRLKRRRWGPGGFFIVEAINNIGGGTGRFAGPRASCAWSASFDFATNRYAGIHLRGGDPAK